MNFLKYGVIALMLLMSLSVFSITQKECSPDNLFYYENGEIKPCYPIHSDYLIGSEYRVQAPIIKTDSINTSDTSYFNGNVVFRNKTEFEERIDAYEGIKTTILDARDQVTTNTIVAKRLKTHNSEAIDVFKIIDFFSKNIKSFFGFEQRTKRHKRIIKRENY